MRRETIRLVRAWTPALVLALAGCSGLYHVDGDGGLLPDTPRSLDAHVGGSAYYALDDLHAGSSVCVDDDADDHRYPGICDALFGMPHVDTLGHLGSAFAFDGSANEGFRVTPADALATPSQFTVTAWLLAETGFEGCPLNRTDSTVPGGDVWQLCNDADGLHVFNTGVATGALHDGIQIPWDDTWHHVALTWDGGVELLYIDAEVTGAVSVELHQHGSDQYTFGADIDPDGSGQPYADAGFTGSLDEIRMFDRALGAAEIQDEFTAP